ncbi:MULTISPECIES: ABC transporter permease [unclassified Pseudomonas]|uniref:ABC transporter permease n=1 Tax=unclassified Pseudomonas TaxID=196821 RepID=UPI000EA89B96|nr:MULTISPECIES: ABC transporter permease [unclassified Pseudomonas]AYF90917.1 ABC transporter permease [Pseudomonas sp. DY-1]MDH4656144.1 ABC transporter permease [Pseudomonas sp. BN606]MRK21247.1 ABC transporter permease [Pseudomonas sp. JG-B]
MVWNEFNNKYLASYLGLFWAFAQPVSLIVVIWLVFELGLRQTNENGPPFPLWLATGLLPWLFLVESINGCCNSIVGKRFLVRRVSFRISLLPIISVLVALIVHLVLVSLLLSVLALMGIGPSIYWIQIPYFMLCALVLVLGGGWLISALVVFISDIKYLVAICIQFGFWCTPIVWGLDRLPEKYQVIAFVNPAAYIVDGYRKSLFGQEWFFSSGWTHTLAFWAWAVIVAIVGATVFRRLRPHFADVI